MVSKPYRIQTARDRLHKNQIEIKQLEALIRLRDTARPVLPTRFSGGSPAGNIGGNSDGNSLSILGGSMIGNIAFDPKLIFVSNGRVNLDPESNTPKNSSNILVTGQGTPDNIRFIDGAERNGQIIYYQGTNQQIQNIINANLLSISNIVGDGNTTVTVTLPNTGTLSNGSSVNVLGTDNFDINNGIVAGLIVNTSFTYQRTIGASTTPESFATIQDGNILTSDGNTIILNGTLSLNGAPIVTLKFDNTAPGGAWRVVSSSIVGGGGGGSLSEPIELGFNEVVTQTPSIKTIVAGNQFNPSHINLDKSIEIQLDISGTTNKYKSIFVIFDTTGSGFTVTWPASVLNPPIINDSVAQRISVILYTIDNGTLWTHATSVGSNSSGFVGNLSALTIDVNKDWLAQGISNLGTLSGVTGIIMNGAIPLIQGIDKIQFVQAGQSIQNKANPDGGILYNVDNLQSHIFRSDTDEIARFEEAAANVFRLNMLDNQIINAQNIAFDVAATFAGSGAIPTIGYDDSSAEFLYNIPSSAKHVWTTNNTELMGLTISQLTFLNGLKIQANPNGTNPGISMGSFAGDPATTTNGDMWYNSASNKFRTKENGVNVDVIVSTADFATIKLDNLGVTAINADLLFGATGVDMGTNTIPLNSLFVEEIRLQQGIFVTNKPTITSLTGNSVDIHMASTAEFNLDYQTGGTVHHFGPTRYLGKSIILDNSLTFNDSASDPASDGQFVKNGNVMAAQAILFEFRRNSIVVNAEPAEISIRKLADSITIGTTVATLNFQSGISSPTTWGRINIGPTVGSGSDASFMQLLIRGGNALINAVSIQGNDNNGDVQFLFGANDSVRLQPVLQPMGYFVTPQATDFLTNIGTSGSLEIPQINDGSPSLTDLNQAAGTFDGMIVHDINDGRIYIKNSSIAWDFYNRDGQIT